MRNKRKGILMASAILGSAAIVSTGFAAWVITSSTTETATGNIEVDAVNDNRLSVGKSWKDSKDTIYFGAPETMNATNPWLLNKDGEKECLSVTLIIDLSFKNPGTRTDEKDIDGTLKVTSFTCSGELDSTLVRMPELENTTYTVTDGGAVEIPIKFQWGTKFGSTSTNPYNYYNDGTKTGDEYGDDAYNTLTSIYDYNRLTFTLNLEFTWANS